MYNKCSIIFVFRSYGYDNVNYLDDLGGAEEEDSAEEAFQTLGWILSSLKIEESQSKATVPGFLVVFLRILFNLINMTLEIPTDN